MTSIVSVLKSEIARVTRLEMRAETETLKKASVRYRAEIAHLRRQVAVLEQQAKRMEKALSRIQPAQAASKSSPERPTRFSPAGLKKLRERHKLSAPTLAAILNVSAQTIYNWEAGTSRPGKDMVGNIAILRKMGKREVRRRIEVMQSAS